MKKAHGVAVAISFLLTSTLYAASATKLVDIEWATASKSLPAKAEKMIPGLYVRYASKVYQLVLLDRSIDLNKSAPAIAEKIYFPADVEWIKPVVAFQEKNGTLRYWYCKEQQPIQALPQIEVGKSNNQLFKVSIASLPSDVIPPENNQAQELASCTYKIVSMNK